MKLALQIVASEWWSAGALPLTCRAGLQHLENYRKSSAFSIAVRHGLSGVPVEFRADREVVLAAVRARARLICDLFVVDFVLTSKWFLWLCRTVSTGGLLLLELIAFWILIGRLC